MAEEPRTGQELRAALFGEPVASATGLAQPLIDQYGNEYGAQTTDEIIREIEEARTDQELRAALLEVDARTKLVGVGPSLTAQHGSEPTPKQEDLGGNTMAQEPTMEELIRGRFHDWAVEQQQYHEEISRRMSEPGPKPGEIPITLKMPAYLEEHLHYDPNTTTEEPPTDQLLRGQLFG